MSEVVVPNEMARTLGVTGLQLRKWLRAESAAGRLFKRGVLRAHPSV